jgi:hypothetical protein
MKYLILISLLLSPSFAFEFYVIEVTQSQSFNYFFSYPMTVLFITIPMIALLDFLKKVDK